ncbi:MAG TPA: GNAT family N-acetyltransferase, partial [Anaerolineaceae bacterium]|nr:GNAT family N-acetyltransferase [Anaerolineaceae bacterium]
MSKANNTVLIRPFRDDKDLAFAAKLTIQEAWHSETLSELQNFYKHDREGCLIAEIDNQPVGICIATPYAHTGFIGELIVDHPYRKQGIGFSLMENAIEFLTARDIKTIFLDGVQNAVQMYKSLGFLPLYRSLRFFGQLEEMKSNFVRQMRENDLGEINSLDKDTFGEDRSFFFKERLVQFPELAFVYEKDGVIQAYLFGRIGVGGWVTAGPWGSYLEEKSQMEILTHFQAAIGNQPFSIGVLEPRKSIVKQL